MGNDIEIRIALRLQAGGSVTLEVQVPNATQMSDVDRRFIAACVEQVAAQIEGA